MYPISFFTFKKELVGGPPDWEKERHVETAEKPPRPAPGTVAPLADTLGKRVSKPPEKLIMETEKEAETPSRASKRTIRAPDKFDGDVVQPPPAKQPRLESPGQQHPPQRRPTSDTEAAASPATAPASRVGQPRLLGRLASVGPAVARVVPLVGSGRRDESDHVRREVAGPEDGHVLA